MPGTQVTVRLSGPLAERLGNRRVVELGPGATVRDLLGALGLGDGADGRAADTVAVVAGGTIVAHEHGLADGDELDVLVPVAGG